MQLKTYRIDNLKQSCNECACYNQCVKVARSNEMVVKCLFFGQLKEQLIKNNTEEYIDCIVGKRRLILKIKNYKLKPEICLNELLKHDFEYTDRYERWYDFYDDVTKMYIDNDGFFCNEGYWIEHYSEEDAGDTYHIPEQRIDEDKEHWIQDLIDADLIDIVEVIDEQS